MEEYAQDASFQKKKMQEGLLDKASLFPSGMTIGDRALLKTDIQNFFVSPLKPI